MLNESFNILLTHQYIICTVYNIGISCHQNRIFII